VQTFPYSEIKCRRDTKLIVDAISQDLLYPTPGMSQSTFAGIQYWSQGNYTGDIEDQLEPTVAAITYLKELSVKEDKNLKAMGIKANKLQVLSCEESSLTDAMMYGVLWQNPKLKQFNFKKQYV
jgi:hypothetical protein